MLLRSTRSDGLDARVDVLFKDIAALQLPTAFDGLLITEASNDELLKLGPQLGSNSMVNKNVFLIQGSNYSGYVVAGSVFWHEDEGTYYDESYFKDSF
jgi:hypothetical protein